MIDPSSNNEIEPRQPTSAEEPTEIVEYIAVSELEPADDVFEPESLLNARRLPGPGIVESCAWFMGFLITHVIGGLIAAVLVLSYNLVRQGIEPGDKATIEQMANSLLKGASFEMISGEMLFFVLIAITAALWRTGKDPARQLGITPISARQMLLLLTGAFPLMLFCGGLHQQLNTVWDGLLKLVPQLKFLDGTNTNEFLSQFKDGVPLPMLLLAIAVCPALGEEIIFRGVIGRGLTARYGLIVGVFLTSCFFAAAHVHPAHALAVLPLGIYVHIAYLATRSFLASVLVHFINNAMAVILLHYSSQLEGHQLGDDSAQPAWMMVVSGCIAVATAVALWKTRPEYIRPRGDAWNPGFVTAEVPPTIVDAAVVHQPINTWFYGSVAMAGFFVTSVFAMSLVVALTR